MSILCTLKNINLSFGPKLIFNNAEIAIDSKDRIGLLGLNGKGKSTLFKILSGDIVPDKSVPAFEFTKARGDQDRKFTLFYIPQELPVNGNEDKTAKDFFYIFYPELKKMYETSLDHFEHAGGWDLLNEFESYLKFFGLMNLDLPIKLLSGGEQKKILLSLGLSSRANLILWDEPTNHLDIETIKLFENEMRNFDRAFMLITHDRFLLSKLTNKIFHIENGNIKRFDGSYSDYLNFLVEHEATKQRILSRLKNTLEREQAWMRQGVKARGTRSKKRVENFQDLKSKVNTIKLEAKKYLDLNLQNAKRQTKILVSSNDLSFSYNGEKVLFNKLNIEIQKGDKIGLLGKNGVGKTTLLKLIIGELNPSSGALKTADNLKIQYLSQKRDELDTDRTPYQVLGDGSDFVDLPDGSKRHVISYFESFLFHRDEINRPLKTFSGGEKSRLQLALNLTKPGDILIFDEPTNDLDLETIELLESKLTEFQGALIIISHDRAFLSTVTNKVWVIDNQEIEKFEGGYEQVEPYLEALELDRELKEEENESKPIKEAIETKVVKEVKKLSNKDKETLSNLYTEVEALEAKLKIIESKLAGFDFSKLSDPNNGELKILTDAQNFLEEKLLSIYQNIEELEA
jgi:ATP-binding cassette subfamily F protein uup